MTIGLITTSGTPSASTYYNGAGGWTTPASGAPTRTIDTLTIPNATSTTWALGVSPGGASPQNAVDLYISGVYQSKGSYSVTGSTLTLAGGLTFPNGALVESVTTT